ncbi:hypothetical protein F4781DRAFT_432692 [Annulohypoxylon bovei var. microspora]|nr:hypothetical protein F4781DRAFT_432692 [Annulohypoxylon bovei var. microspora]
MDPVTAIGLACSVLSFIEFSTVENDTVEPVVTDLHKLTLELKKHKLKGTSLHEIAIKELALGCETLSRDLSTLLQTLKAIKGSHWESIRIKLRSMCKKGEVAMKRSVLAEYRSQISVQLLALLNERHISIRTRIEWEFKEKHSDLVQRLSDLQAKVEDILDNQTKERRGSAVTEDKGFPPEKMQDILVVLNTLIDFSRHTSPEVRVLRQLYFKSMYDREDSVGDVGLGTYKWFLDEEADEEVEKDNAFIRRSSDRWTIEETTQIRQLQLQTRQTFLKWLSNGSGIFYLSGKAGSGKSTLVKFLAYHHLTKEELDIWSGDKRLVFARFFAWSTGTDGLKDSVYGLCRSILFTVLKQCPELIPEVFPDAYRTFLTTTYEPFIDEPFFRYSKVLEGLRKLTTRSANRGYRFCFFIDGLDEFKNDIVSKHSHELLADTLTSWAGNDDVKILVSSRPTHEFMSAFSNSLHVKLHELTKLDIMRIGRYEFEKHKEFARIKDCYVTLVHRIAEDAQGVFLWAHLTIAKLLQAIKSIQDVEKLEKLIDDTPMDINILYQSLLDSIDTSYRDKVLKILWFVGQGIRCRILWITWIDELFTPKFDFPTKYSIQAYSDAEIEKRLREAEFLVLQSKGLLEFETRSPVNGTRPTFSYITFSHRTVREFVMQSEQMSVFSEKLQELDGSILEIKAMLAELWFLNHTYSQELTNGLGKKLELGYTWRHGCEDSSIFVDAQYLHVFDKGSTATLGAEYSYMHWVAGYVGDWEYVRRKLQDKPELVHANGDLSLLLSAATSQIDSPIFDRLLEMGASPNETIKLIYPKGNGEASMWMVFCTLVANAIVEAVVYGGHLHDSSMRDVLRYVSREDFYDVFRTRLKKLLRMGDVNTNALVVIG